MERLSDPGSLQGLTLWSFLQLDLAMLEMLFLFHEAMTRSTTNYILAKIQVVL